MAKKAVKKKPAKKPPAKAAAAPKPKAKSAKKARRPLPGKAKPKAKASRTAKTGSPGPSLGRPLVRAEEKLYMLFKEDYHARQIFEFLRVETVGELEQFSPQQIVQILSAPVRKTIERIRERLAEHKRALREDASFALDYLSSHPSVE